MHALKEDGQISRAEIFARTENLNVAAGVLMGVRIGWNVMTYWNKLCEGNASLPAEKIRMMLTGKHKGVGGLYMDAFGWKPCRKNRNRMSRGNSELFETVKWTDLMY